MPEEKEENPKVVSVVRTLELMKEVSVISIARERLRAAKAVGDYIVAVNSRELEGLPTLPEMMEEILHFNPQGLSSGQITAKILRIAIKEVEAEVSEMIDLMKSADAK